MKGAERKETDAHLTVAIRWEDYSIALTKSFQKTVKLQGKRAKDREMWQSKELL